MGENGHYILAIQKPDDIFKARIDGKYKEGIKFTVTSSAYKELEDQSFAIKRRHYEIIFPENNKPKQHQEVRGAVRGLIALIEKSHPDEARKIIDSKRNDDSVDIEDVDIEDILRD